MRHWFRKAAISNRYRKGVRRLQQPVQRLLLVLLKRPPKKTLLAYPDDDSKEKRNPKTERIRPLLRQLPILKFLRKMGRRIFGPLHRVLVVPLLKRASDPEPEVVDIDPRPSSALRRFAVNIWIWLPVLAVLSAIGLLFIAYGYNMSRNVGAARLRTFFYPGLILIFTPTAARIISPFPSRIERICLITLAWISCFLLKILTSPLYFFLYDEFLHWRTEDDIIKTSHLFTINSLLPVSPFYPGLEITTNAFSMLTGLDVFHSALVLLCIARIMMVLTLFSLNETLFQSARTASIAAIFYMVNQHFTFFATQYGYESITLPLATVIFLIMAPYQPLTIRLRRLDATINSSLLLPTALTANLIADRNEVRNDRYAITILAFIIFAATTFSHHATSFFFIALVLFWAVIHRFLQISPFFRSSLTWLGLVGAVFAVGWVNYPDNTVLPYLTGFLSTVFSHAGKHFAGASVNGYSPMIWEKNLALYTTYALLGVIPFGWLCIWLRYRSNSLILMLGLTSMGFHASQVLRSSDNGIQLADRASAVFFIAIGTVMAVMITQFWPLRKLHWMQVSLIACALTLLFLDGYIASGGSGYGSPPTPYVVGADSRSIEIQGIQAALWAHTYLGSNNNIGTDRTNQLLMGTFGDQRIIDTIQDHIDVAPIFFSYPLDSASLALMKRGHIRYLIIDRRLSTSLPAVGEYFEKGEPGAMVHTVPVDLKALMKFDTMPSVNKIFDGGSIVIFDVRKLSNAN
jgi:hypothetical protein